MSSRQAFWEPCWVPLLLIKTTILSEKGSCRLVQATQLAPAVWVKQTLPGNIPGHRNLIPHAHWLAWSLARCDLHRGCSPALSPGRPQKAAWPGDHFQKVPILLTAFREGRDATAQPWAAPCSSHPELTQAHFSFSGTDVAKQSKVCQMETAAFQRPREWTSDNTTSPHTPSQTAVLIKALLQSGFILDKLSVTFVLLVNCQCGGQTGFEICVCLFHSFPRKKMNRAGSSRKQLQNKPVIRIRREM